MSEWINCNLPYYVNVDMDYPEYPNLDDRERKEFGQTLEESREKVSKLNPEYKCSAFNRYESYREIIQNELFDEGVSHQAENFAQLVRQRLVDLDDHLINLVLEHHKFVRVIDEWFSIQPEWLEYQEKSEKASEDYKKRCAETYFSAKEVNRSGTLIEVKDGDKTYFQLIGDINTAGGVCNDCMGFSRDAIVLRYKTVYNPE